MKPYHRGERELLKGAMTVMERQGRLIEPKIALRLIATLEHQEGNHETIRQGVKILTAEVDRLKARESHLTKALRRAFERLALRRRLFRARYVAARLRAKDAEEQAKAAALAENVRAADFVRNYWRAEEGATRDGRGRCERIAKALRLGFQR